MVSVSDTGVGIPKSQHQSRYRAILTNRLQLAEAVRAALASRGNLRDTTRAALPPPFREASL